MRKEIRRKIEKERFGNKMTFLVLAFILCGTLLASGIKNDKQEMIIGFSIITVVLLIEMLTSCIRHYKKIDEIG